jgi:hypothetical protein
MMTTRGPSVKTPLSGPYSLFFSLNPLFSRPTEQALPLRHSKIFYFNTFFFKIKCDAIINKNLSQNIDVLIKSNLLEFIN